MRLMSLFHRRRRPADHSPRRPGNPIFVPRLENLEDRSMLSSGYLAVGSFDNNAVLTYDETTGAFESQFDPHNRANLKTPVGGVFGEDGNLYVSGSLFSNGQQHGVLQYDGRTGVFQREFAT